MNQILKPKKRSKLRLYIGKNITLQKDIYCGHHKNISLPSKK